MPDLTRPCPICHGSRKSPSGRGKCPFCSGAGRVKKSAINTRKRRNAKNGR